MNHASANVLERRFIPAGTLIIAQGEPGSSAFLIQSGIVEVFTENDGKSITLAKLDAGQIFGEMALISDEPRAASIRALEDCNLIVITRAAFKKKLEKTDPTIKAVVQMLVARVLSANQSVINKKNA